MKHPRIMIPFVVLLAGCGDATGPEGSGRSKTEEFAWNGQVAPTGTVEIKNINGDVRARAGRGTTVRVRALKDGRKDDPSTVRIEVVETANGVTICAVYPDVPDQPPNQCLPGRLAGQLSSRDNDVSVTFDIEVPAGRAFVVATGAGSVEATGLTGHVEARTIGGDITLSTSATAAAATINGNITATIGGVMWDRDLSFRAGEGNVTVRVPAWANAEITGSTGNGSISTDFPLRVTRVGTWQQVQGTIGSGGRKLDITTAAGNIALRAN